MIEPHKLIAGDSIRWRRILPDYPPVDGWTLQYKLVSLGQKHTIEASGDGNGYQVNLTSLDTSAWAAGEYQLVAMVSRDDDRHTVGSQRVIVKPNPASADYDPRSHAEKMLSALREQLQKKATKGKQSVTVDGQTVTYATWDEMVNAEQYYRGRVNRQRRRARDKRTGRKSNRVLARMP